MARLTAKDVAERLGVNYVVASGIVTKLAASGQATLVEKVFHDSGKGKPTRVYEIPDTVTLDLSSVPAAAVAEEVAEVADVSESAEAA